MDGYECGGFNFYSNFDSGNLHRVEQVITANSSVVSTPHTAVGRNADDVDFEFNLWTKPDCAGTEFENGNRTWFYFAVKCPVSSALVKFNIVDMNKQAKLYSQGMGPVYRIFPGKINWERILDRPTFLATDVFTLSFKFRMPENNSALIHLAFTYPFPYQDLLQKLDTIDKRFESIDHISSLDDIYYVRENVISTVQNRRFDMLTISSFHYIKEERETRLNNLFPDHSVPRPYKFDNKKVIFLSARVHPGETPSSFVLNGFLNLIVNREDAIAIALRRNYVFKIIPCLNPDGVVNGHYRTDTRGVNLNRVYLNPSLREHPTIYAARALIRYYHYGEEREDTDVRALMVENENILNEVGMMSLNEKNRKKKVWCNKCRVLNGLNDGYVAVPSEELTKPIYCAGCGDCIQAPESDLFMYIDMHGHASKKGIFMYGNHFDDLESNVKCMLMPKIMSVNNHNFHFTACNFTERNMYLKDKRDGMSREGSGRVAVYKLTGLIQSYTLECNYNTGRLVNILPPTIKESNRMTSTLLVPPKYTPQIFEEVGRALGASILDLTSINPLTRLPHSEYHSLNGLRDWLRVHCTHNLGETRKTSKKPKIRQASSLHAQGKTIRPVLKTRSFPSKYHSKKSNQKQRQQKSTVLKGHRERERIGSPQPSCSNNLPTPSSSASSSSGGFGHKGRNKNTATNMTSVVQSAKFSAQAGGEKPQVNHIIRNIKNTSTKTKIKLTPRITSATESIKASVDSKRAALDEVKVKEICYVKGQNGKRVIATYERNNEIEEENLIVAWDASNTRPQVFTHKPRVPTFLAQRRASGNSDGDNLPSKSFRVHNFQKSSASFAKLSKRGFTSRLVSAGGESSSKGSKSKKAKKMVRKKKSRKEVS